MKGCRAVVTAEILSTRISNKRLSGARHQGRVTLCRLHSSRTQPGHRLISSTVDGQSSQRSRLLREAGSGRAEVGFCARAVG